MSTTELKGAEHSDHVIGIDGWDDVPITKRTDAYHTAARNYVRTLRNRACFLWLPIFVLGIALIALGADQNLNVVAVAVVAGLFGFCVLTYIILRISIHLHVKSYDLNPKENPEKLKWGSRMWRDLIQAVIRIRSDPTNRFRLTRALQVSVPSLMPVEAYLLDRFMGSLEDDENIAFHMEQAFKNKNVGRIIVQALPIFDILWHNSTRMEWIRILDFLGDFPATEIQAATFGNVLNLLFRSLLGEGRWYTRYLTGDRQELTVDGKAAAQNLAPANQLESVFRAQHGTHIGRIKTQQFRNANRLPTDETIIRAFFGNPALTITDNGFEHAMRAVVKHWQFLLNNKSGDFAHQRQELLDPINAMRVALPAILTQLVALRGINVKDKADLAPFIKRCELLEPRDGFAHLKILINDFQHNLMKHVCAGVPSRTNPLTAWISLVLESVNRLEEESKEVIKLICSVRSGIKLGISVIENIEWKYPTDSQFKELIPRYIENPKEFKHEGLNSRMIESALDKLLPKDKRTFIEFVEKKIPNPKSRSIFAFTNKRVRSLLKREIFRYRFNEEIQKLEKKKKEPVAAKIAAAQKAWLEFELKHLKVFGLNAFLDHAKLRKPLRDLQVVSQLQATEIDESKIRNLLALRGSQRVQNAKDLEIGKTYWLKRFYPHGRDEEFKFKGYDENTDTCQFEANDGQQHSFPWETSDDDGKLPEGWVKLKDDENKEYHYNLLTRKTSLFKPSDIDKDEIVGLKERGIFDMRPEHYLIVGGGPTGLLSALHVLGSAISSGGTVTVSEKRGALGDGASAFSRAQVVRLDPRWIAMLRYHLGTRFEDIFVQLDGETMAHSSNFLIDQGFVELTTKTLEDMMQWGVAMRRSAELLRYHTESSVDYDWAKHRGTTRGHQLKVGDTILDFVDKTTKKKFEYATVVETEDIEHKGYKRTKRPEALKVKLECFDGKSSTMVHCETTKADMFYLDLRHTHFVIATGKGANAKDHFSVTTKEYYGVSCLSGAKVSHVMHQMGVQRWKNHLVNDIRSIVEDNTRLIGDFTKVISVEKIAEYMLTHSRTANWRAAAEEEFGSTTKDFSTMYEELVDELVRYKNESDNYLRETLQARVFETGDNTYLGMEVNREFKIWQHVVYDSLSSRYLAESKDAKKNAQRFEKALDRFTSKLFFQGAFDALGSGDVFNPGAKYKIPNYTLIDCHKPTTLGRLVKGEAFNIKESPDEERKGTSPLLLEPGRYELLSRGKPRWYCPCLRSAYIVRDFEGKIYQINDSGMEVYVASDFTRGADGKTESRVAFSTFPVAHYVNTGAMRIADKKQGVVYVPVGDGQSTPHFMRYSGLTGAAINAMELNNFAEAGLNRASFIERYESYIFNINWSNGEVVTRGTGFGYGQDGFLRPGFKYQPWLQYLFHKIEEYSHVSKCDEKKVVDPVDIFNYDWMRKFASALIPRRLEHNTLYQKSLIGTLNEELENFMTKMKFENPFDDSSDRLKWKRSFIKKTFIAIIDFARTEADAGQRVSTEQENQLNPLDSIADNQSPEVQAFIDGFTISASLTAAGLAAADQGSDTDGEAFISGVGLAFQLVGPILAFSSVSNASRYLRRNEDFQAYFMEEKLLPLKEALHAQRGKSYEIHGISENDPFIQQIKTHLEKVQKLCNLHDRPLDGKFVKKVESIWDQGLRIGRNGGLRRRASLTSVHENERKTELKRIKNYVVDSSASLVMKTEEVIKILLKDLICKEYHDRTYTKDAMTSLALALMSFRDAATESPKTTDGLAADIEEVLQEMDEWEPEAKLAIEDGLVKFGLCRRRSFRNNYIFRILAFFRTFLPAILGCETLAMRTKKIIKKLRDINKALAYAKNDFSFEKEVRDLEEFYYASIEVNKVTLIMVAGFIAAVTGTVQFILAILDVSGVDGIDPAVPATITGAVGPIPVIIAVFFLIKQQSFISKPVACGGRIHGLKTYIGRVLHSFDGPAMIQSALQSCDTILNWQFVINVLRIIASATAAAALICTLAAPFIIGELALVALGSGLLAFAFSLYVTYGYYYYLDEKAPIFVCHAFKKDIVNMYERFLRSGKTYNALVDNRTAWAYTARLFLHQYRFDTLFDAPRLNSMFQYVQSGMNIAGKNLLPANNQPDDYGSRSSGLAQGFPRRVHLEELDEGAVYHLLIRGRLKPYRFVRMDKTNIWFTHKKTRNLEKFDKGFVRKTIFHPQIREEDDVVSVGSFRWDEKYEGKGPVDGPDSDLIVRLPRETRSPNGSVIGERPPSSTGEASEPIQLLKAKRTSSISAGTQPKSSVRRGVRGTRVNSNQDTELPPGWMMLTDSSGKKYYMNKATKESSEKRPVFVENKTKTSKDGDDAPQNGQPEVNDAKISPTSDTNDGGAPVKPSATNGNTDPSNNV